MHVHLHGHGHRAHQPGQRGGSPSSRLLGPQPVGDLPEFGDGGAELGDALVEQAVDVDRPSLEVSLGEPDRHPERHQPLLRAVVQVSLEPPPLLVADLDEPCPARLHLLERPASSSRSRTTSTRVVQRAATSRSSSGTASPLASRITPMAVAPSTTGVAPSAGDRCAVGVDVVVGSRHPVSDPQIRGPGGQHGEPSSSSSGRARPALDVAVQVSQRGERRPAQRIDARVDPRLHPTAQRQQGERADGRRRQRPRTPSLGR